MHQSKVVLTPYWFPYIGNLVAIAKCHKRAQADGLGRNAVLTVPDQLLKDKNGLVPPLVAINGIINPGVLLINSCHSVERMMIKNAKCIDKSDDSPKIKAGFGGTSFIHATNGEKQAALKKYLKSTYNGENFDLFSQTIKRVVFKKLQLL